MYTRPSNREGLGQASQSSWYPDKVLCDSVVVVVVIVVDEQDAEKLIKFVISELRKALKVKLSLGGAVMPENFLSLIQVR